MNSFTAHNRLRSSSLRDLKGALKEESQDEIQELDTQTNLRKVRSSGGVLNTQGPGVREWTGEDRETKSAKTAKTHGPCKSDEKKVDRFAETAIHERNVRHGLDEFTLLHAREACSVVLANASSFNGEVRKHIPPYALTSTWLYYVRHTCTLCSHCLC